MLQFAVLVLCAARIWKPGHYFYEFEELVRDDGWFFAAFCSIFSVEGSLVN